MAFPRCEFTDIERLWCTCPECAQGFTLTADESDFLTNKAWPYGDPRPVPLRAPTPPRSGKPVTLDHAPRNYGHRQPVTSPGWGNACATPRCGRPAGDRFVCPECVERLEVALGDVTALCDDLDIACQKLAKVRRWSSPTTTSPPPESVLWETLDATVALHALGRTRPDLPAAGALRDDLHAELVSAARILTERAGRTYDGDPDTVGVSLWLLRHTSAVALDPAGGDIVAGITRAHARALASIDNAPERPYIGLCDQCRRPMYANPRHAEHQCVHCGASYDVDERQAWIMSQVRDYMAPVTDLVTLAEMAGHRLPKHRVRYIAERSGRMLVSGYDRHGTAQYRMGDFLDAIADARLAGA